MIAGQIGGKPRERAHQVSFAQMNQHLIEGEKVSLSGVSHYDRYDQQKAVGQALEKAVPYLKRHLGVGEGLVGAVKRLAADAMSLIQIEGEAR